MQCTRCGTLVDLGINVCPKCGNFMPEENYVNYRPNAAPQVNSIVKANLPRLIVIDTGGNLTSYDLLKEQSYIGRLSEKSKCDIKINSPLVSSVHGYIMFFKNSYYYIDCENTNGTYYNSEKIDRKGKPVSEALRLNEGDILSVGSTDNESRIVMIFTYSNNNNSVWNNVNLRQKQNVTIGRAPSSDICISNITVSRNHATCVFDGKNAVITDMKSFNGTMINGVSVKQQVLKDLDKIMIGTAIIFYIKGFLVYKKDLNNYPDASAQNIRGQGAGAPLRIKQGGQAPKPNNTPSIRSTNGFEVTVKDVSRIVKCKRGTGINGGSKKYILQHISLTISAGELVAICGGSGAGKTTFMNCINGFEPATSGQVLINGTDLYKNYSSIKNHIGYVPQQDIVHDNLTLVSMLKYTAKLRLQSDITPEEINKIVANVLDMVDLTAQKDTFIKKLSGGQRKRASIAVELVSDPSLFFLDEPTSGLDPEAETHLMHRLQKLSGESGKTVIVITHTLQNIHLFDKVIFLAPGGKLCFYGSPEDAKKFFGVNNLADAYEKISADIDWYVRRFELIRRGF